MILNIKPLGYIATSGIDGTMFNRVHHFSLEVKVDMNGNVEQGLLFHDTTIPLLRELKRGFEEVME